MFTPEALPEAAAAAMVVRLCDGCAAPCRVDAAALARRRACVVAPEAAYEALQATYHYDRAAGRRLLCARFGVVDEVPAGSVY